MDDLLDIVDAKLESRLFIGSALYPSPQIMSDSIKASGAQVVTVSLRRQGAGQGTDFWDIIKALGIHILPNTAGCHSVKEAVTTAKMAREVFETDWIKLELIGDDYTLQPDTCQLIEATKILIADGFNVFPYTTEDLIVAEKLADAGCQIIMPWGSPIGSGQGLLNTFALRTMRERLPDIKLVVDAGIGKPSDAVEAFQLGFDAVLVNSAIALAEDPVAMGTAFKYACQAGRIAYTSGAMKSRDMASPSTPTIGTPFWHKHE